MTETREEYISLLREDEQSNPTKEKGSLNADASAHRLIRWATILILACTLIDIFLLFYLGILYVKSRTTDGELELRTPYPNLDNLYSSPSFHSSPHAPIISHARAFAQVSAAEPNRVFPPLHAAPWHSSDGVIPSDDRRLFVTSQISTIAQFRAIDFGMESCALALTIPPDTNISNLDIWALPVTKKLDMRALSWASLPRSRIHMGTFNATSEGPRFDCSSGTYYTFEIACKGPDCGADVVGKGKKVLGLYMKQYQTA